MAIAETLRSLPLFLSRAQCSRQIQHRRERVIRTIAAAVAAKRRAETMGGNRTKLIGAARRA
jgi:hypothetical protein